MPLASKDTKAHKVLKNREKFKGDSYYENR
jgi:hypothetical protein